MLRFLMLAMVWLLWSGHYTYSFEDPLIAVFGVASCAFVAWLYGRLVDATIYPQEPVIAFRSLAYLPWLVWQVVLSNLHVARVILSPKLPIAPRVLTVKASQRQTNARVLYANSITLTPGTISCELQGDTIWVHALTESTAADLKGGEMDRRVRALEPG